MSYQIGKCCILGIKLHVTFAQMMLHVENKSLQSALQRMAIYKSVLTDNCLPENAVINY